MWQIPMRDQIVSLRDVPHGDGHARLTGPEDVDADLVCTRRRDLDLLDFERLARAPADGGLARNGLSGSVRHGGQEESSVRAWACRVRKT